ncbi:hypothetical protein ACJRO7_011628 [Eucalyptus globulus]|uniref:Uncharacterized protein n=1 Tax=Eucalyptus globulus TaxID=34317 RepID=A0ABD3LLC0_EUCGL
MGSERGGRRRRDCKWRDRREATQPERRDQSEATRDDRIRDDGTKERQRQWDWRQSTQREATQLEAMPPKRTATGDDGSKRGSDRIRERRPKATSTGIERVDWRLRDWRPRDRRRRDQREATGGDEIKERQADEERGELRRGVR